MSAQEIVRDPEYGKRLVQACDAKFECPPLHRGRNTWIADELKRRFDLNIRTEMVRKWMGGIAKPRPAKNEMIAQLLDVDPVWLYFGVEPTLTTRERRVRNAEADGAVNVVAGFIQMDGGHPAFPEEDDKRARDEHVDIYAVIRGANYSFHIALAQADGDNWRFAVPSAGRRAIVIGMVRQGFNVRLIELTNEILEGEGKLSSGAITLQLSDKRVSEMQIESFANRL